MGVYSKQWWAFPMAIITQSLKVVSWRFSWDHGSQRKHQSQQVDQSPIQNFFRECCKWFLQDFFQHQIFFLRQRELDKWRRHLLYFGSWKRPENRLRFCLLIRLHCISNVSSDRKTLSETNHYEETFWNEIQCIDNSEGNFGDPWYVFIQLNRLVVQQMEPPENRIPHF